MLFETEVVACICLSPLHHQKPDFEGQSVIKTSSYLLPFVLEAHRESLPRSCETSARRLSAESAEVYSTADLPASAAHTFPSQVMSLDAYTPSCGHHGVCSNYIIVRTPNCLFCATAVLQRQLTATSTYTVPDKN